MFGNAKHRCLVACETIMTLAKNAVTVGKTKNNNPLDKFVECEAFYIMYGMSLVLDEDSGAKASVWLRVTALDVQYSRSSHCKDNIQTSVLYNRPYMKQERKKKEQMSMYSLPSLLREASHIFEGVG